MIFIAACAASAVLGFLLGIGFMILLDRSVSVP